MNILQALTELYNSQSMDSIFRELAHRILGNLDQMKRITIYDVAELTNSSRTTVWRLVQKLGYQSFSDFKYAIQSAASQYVYYNRIVEQPKNGSSAKLIEEMKRQMRDAASIYANNVTEEALEELTDALAEAAKVYFFLPFRSSAIYSFQQNLWADGKQTAYYCLIPDMLEAADCLDEHSIVLISTLEFTETIDMTQVFEKVKKKGSTIWLTGRISSRYVDYVDRRILSVDTKPASWILAFESFIFTLSERYRGKFIDG